jgi:hypothetical protein
MMKQHKISWTGVKLVFFSLLLPPLSVQAGALQKPQSYTRKIVKTFTVGSGASINITNKYGKVTLQRWNKDEIRAEITITVNASNDQDAKKLADQVVIEDRQSSRHVTLVTDYNKGGNSSFWQKFFGSAGEGRKEVHIDYLVDVPTSMASIDVRNNFGDVAGDNLPGNLTLELNYGNFHVAQVAGTVDVSANYCKGSLYGIQGGAIHANYTDFQLDQVNNLDISSNYSNYRISRAGSIQLKSNYGDITAENIASITSRSTYGDYRITTLQKAGDINTTYGDVRIKSLGTAFDTLTINPTYSDVTVGIPATLAVRLEVHVNYGSIRTGDIPLQQVQKSTARHSSFLQAEAGETGRPSALIQVNASYSVVNFTQKKSEGQ